MFNLHIIMTIRNYIIFLFLLFPMLIWGQETETLTILQTSDVHSRIEPITQKGDQNYDKGG